jgi:hypothetical protein
LVHQPLMEATSSSPQVFEAVLAETRPFGDSIYIRDQFHIAYKRRLQKISVAIPAADALLTALEAADASSQYYVLGDTVVRCAIQQALRQVVTNTHYGLPRADLANVFLAATQHVMRGSYRGPLESGAVTPERLGPNPWHGWIWSEDHSDDVFGRAFQFIVAENYGDALCTPDAQHLAMLRKAASLLEELMPSLARSALSHAHVIAVFPGSGAWKGKASSSQYRVSGTIFLNREALDNPWWVAEHLLHEALHQKLYDFRHGHSVLARDALPYQEALADGQLIVAAWNSPGLTALNAWDTHRVLAAFHVYVHLALFATLAESRAPELHHEYGPLDGAGRPMTASRQACDRARYLGEQVRAWCWEELGLAGQGLVDWLSSILNVLDPSPPPSGACVHLLLARYTAEAKRVEQHGPLAAGVAPRLALLMRGEVARTRHVLERLGAQSALAQFDRAVGSFSDADLGFQLPQVRRLIADTLLRQARDGYVLASPPEPTGPDGMVRDMVDMSSHELAAAGLVT